MRLTIVVLSAGWALAHAASAQPDLRGKVVETLEAGDYTYVSIATKEGNRWAAVPKAALKRGDDVQVDGGVLMEDFDSPRLKRKFDRVLFGTLTRGAAAAVPKAAGKGGRTIAELFAEKARLKGKLVLVRGRVVKYSAKIMGSNWLHLRDGSGNAKDNDLVVTTAQEAAVGDVVTVEGTVTLDKDLGSGYFYPVLLEGARIVER